MGKYIEVEVDLDDFATDDLIEEVESRGYTVTKDIIALEQTDLYIQTILTFLNK